MNWMDAILILRNEILLVLFLLVVIVAEIFSDDQKKGIVNLSIFSMLIITVIGFLPGSYGNLFGNIGTLVVFLQSADFD